MEETKKRPISTKRVLIICLCVLGTVYLLYHIANQFRKDAEFFIVREYTAEDRQPFTGYIFKDEIPLVSYTPGIVNYRYYDGEKIAAGSIVADIYRYGNAESTAQVAAIKKQIEILRKSSPAGFTSAEELDRQIANLYAAIAEKSAAGEQSAADVLSDELLILLAKRDLITEGKTNYDAEIAALEAQRSELLASLGAASESILSEESGYFYSYYDGYASSFTAEAAKNITFDSFDMLTAASPLEAANVIGTVMTDFNWYYICRADAASADGFSAGETYECRFPDNSYSDIIKMKLYSKQTDVDGNALLVFSASSLPRSFHMTRCQRMETVRTTYSGLRIPAEEVRVIDGMTFVYIFSEGAAYLREVDILWEQNGYYIVSDSYESPAGNKTLKLNDIMLVGEKDLYDGKLIK